MMKDGWVYRRGDLYLADLGEPEGSRQGGVRPVIVLQNDTANYYFPTLTSRVGKKAKQTTHYLVKRENLRTELAILLKTLADKLQGI